MVNVQGAHCKGENKSSIGVCYIGGMDEDMKKIVLTEKGKVVFFPSSGTGCWEAALQSTLNIGDTVLGASQ